MNTLAHTLDGLMRIRSSTNGKTGVVEVRSPYYPRDWMYCVYRSLPIDQAWEIFHAQSVHHTDSNIYLNPIVEKGQ